MRMTFLALSRIEFGSTHDLREKVGNMFRMFCGHITEQIREQVILLHFGVEHLGQFFKGILTTCPFVECWRCHLNRFSF